MKNYKDSLFYLILFGSCLLFYTPVALPKTYDCKSCCELGGSAIFHEDKLTPIKPIVIGGEAMNGMLYHNSEDQLMAVIDFYNPILEGKVKLICTSSGWCFSCIEWVK